VITCSLAGLTVNAAEPVHDVAKTPAAQVAPAVNVKTVVEVGDAPKAVDVPPLQVVVHVIVPEAGKTA
jgi:hypothetical protein